MHKCALFTHMYMTFTGSPRHSCQAGAHKPRLAQQLDFVSPRAWACAHIYTPRGPGASAAQTPTEGLSGPPRRQSWHSAPLVYTWCGGAGYKIWLHHYTQDMPRPAGCDAPLEQLSLNQCTKYDLMRLLRPPGRPAPTRAQPRTPSHTKGPWLPYAYARGSSGSAHSCVCGTRKALPCKLPS